MAFGFGPDQYRNYKVALRKNKSIQGDSRSTMDQGTTPVSASGDTYDNPPIEMVCKRLIIKWEPIFNFVHRYLYCRCVIRLSTPSHIVKEQTDLILAPCPRHNKVDVRHKDYGDIDNNQDEYFNRFGGYRSFQGIVYIFAPKIYEILGAERFLPAEHVEDALKVFIEYWNGNEEGLRTVFNEYSFDINDKLEGVGFELPDSLVEAVKDERLRRKNNDAVERKDLGLFDSDELNWNKEQQQDFRDIPMVRELNEILGGKYSGKPHWALED